QGLTQTTVSDHRTAIDWYVSKRGIPVRELPEGGLRMLFADGSADLSFDDERRISNCDMNTPLEGEAAEQWADASTGAEVSAEPSTAASEPAVAATTASPAGAGDEPAEAVETTAGSTESPVSGDRGEEMPESPEAAATPATYVSGDAAASGAAADSADAAPSAADETAGESTPSDTDSEPAAPAEEETPAEKPKKKGLFSKLFGR